jgi:ATP-dependent RNA helicase DHX34
MVAPSLGDVKAEDPSWDFDSSSDSVYTSEISDLNLKEVNLLKIIICSGLYPNVALPDEENAHRKSHEQVYHTASKNFVLVHPTSVYSTHYETMIKRSSTTEDTTFRKDWEFLCYVQLLETGKPYLINAIRVPIIHTCLLFSKYGKSIMILLG